jgi:hypothetical protein
VSGSKKKSSGFFVLSVRFFERKSVVEKISPNLACRHHPLREMIMQAAGAHVNPLRAPSVMTTTGQALALRALFISLDAQNWTTKERNRWYKDLVLEPLYNNLNVGHIRYQWTKFHGEFVIKLEVGHAFSRASRIMARRNNVFELAFEILASMRASFGGLPDPELAIPTDLLGYLDRCVKVEVALGLGQSGDDILTLSDIDKLNSDVTYIQGLFMTYSEVWFKFAAMEVHPTVAVSTRPDLTVADLSLQLHSERYIHYIT